MRMEKLGSFLKDQVHKIHASGGQFSHLPHNQYAITRNILSGSNKLEQVDKYCEILADMGFNIIITGKLNLEKFKRN